MVLFQLNFYVQMSTFFNQRSSLSGKIPNGLFNAMFGFGSASWAKDATDTKCLALDGYFISLFNLRIDRCSLKLRDQIRKDVPTTWQPHAIARFPSINLYFYLYLTLQYLLDFIEFLCDIALLLKEPIVSKSEQLKMKIPSSKNYFFFYSK